MFAVANGIVTKYIFCEVINLWLEGTWYFGTNGHIGTYGGIGASGGNLKKKPKWNIILELGLPLGSFKYTGEAENHRE